MANDWPLIRLGDYVDSNLGKMLDAQKNKGVPCPYLGNSNVRWGAFDLNDLALMKFEEGEVERYRIQDGDLIVCEGGEPGRCAVWREQVPDMKIQKALHRIRPKDGLNNYYLFYWFMLAGRAGWLEPFFTGTTIKHLTGKALNELKVPLPPIKEQRAIAHILGTLDDKIELNRKQNETLEAMARALFKAWFVDFEPVRAKMEGRWQRGQSLPGLPAHLYDLFPDRLVESELGEIPDGWAAGTFGRIMSQRSERVGKRTVTVLSAVASGKLAISDDHFTKRVYSKETDKYLLVEQWDFAYNPSRINIGSIGMLEEDIVGGVSPVYVVARPKTPYQWFLEFSIRRAQTRTWINTLASGSVRQSLAYTDFASIPCVIPTEAVIEEFNRRWSTLRDVIRSREAESRTLAQLRDTLLPKLISGELRVSDAEAFLKEARL